MRKGCARMLAGLPEAVLVSRRGAGVAAVRHAIKFRGFPGACEVTRRRLHQVTPHGGHNQRSLSHDNQLGTDHLFGACFLSAGQFDPGRRVRGTLRLVVRRAHPRFWRTACRFRPRAPNCRPTVAIHAARVRRIRCCCGSRAGRGGTSLRAVEATRTEVAAWACPRWLHPYVANWPPQRASGGADE